MGTIFSAYDIRGRAGESLTVEYSWNVGKAFAEWLPEEGSVVIAKSVTADASIVHALIEGLQLQGRNVIDTGEGDQQTVMTALFGDQSTAGGIAITHDDAQNIEVISLYDAQGVAVTADQGLTDIEALIESGNFVPAAEKGQLTTTN